MSTPDQSPAPAPTPAPAAPAKKSNTLVIVLCVVLGLILLVLGSCVATCVYVGKKAKDYARESEKNPKISALALAATFSPGVEVVTKDLNAGTIVLRNKKTGEVVKLDANSFSQDNIADVLSKVAQGKGAGAAVKPEPADVSPPASESADESQAKAAQSAANATALKAFPADFPRYADGDVKTLEASHETVGGMTSSQQVFLTNDAPAVVAEYFGKKLTAAGFVLRTSDNGSDEHGATATRLFQKDGMNITVNFAAQIENGKTRVEVGRIQLKP